MEPRHSAPSGGGAQRLGVHMTFLGFASQLLEIIVALTLAPLLSGWVNQCRAWLQNKSAPGVLQPYRVLHKLFNKESVIAQHASPLFRAAPYIVFGCMLLASAIVPTLSTDLPLSPAPTRSRWSGCSRWRACSSRWQRWMWAPRSARWARGARC